MCRDAEIDRPAAAVDNRRGTDNGGPCGTRDVNRLARGFAGGKHILDDEDAFAGCQAEATPQRQGLRVRSLRKHCPHAETSCHFVADDQPAERWRQHDDRSQGFDVNGNGEPKRGRVGRVLQDKRRLQIAGAVEPR